MACAMRRSNPAHIYLRSASRRRWRRRLLLVTLAVVASVAVAWYVTEASADTVVQLPDQASGGEATGARAGPMAGAGPEGPNRLPRVRTVASHPRYVLRIVGHAPARRYTYIYHEGAPFHVVRVPNPLGSQ